MTASLPELQWRSNITVSPGSLLLNLKDGSHFHGVLGESQITIEFQRRYQQQPDQYGLYSISKTCIPDIVLTLADHSGTRVIVFDAKYRSSVESIHAALDDMHVYRDAIRTLSDTPGIDAAYILTPAHADNVDRFYSDAYRRRYGFGAFDLSPRDNRQLRSLREFVSRLVAENLHGDR